ncbi:hypothetical protein EF808_01860 [archaeon]|nr:MAG: hypothetical protein EF808_01860 [archaeon]
MVIPPHPSFPNGSWPESPSPTNGGDLINGSRNKTARQEELLGQVNRQLDEENIKFIRLQFVDINGAVKSLAISPQNLEDVVANGIMFDGSSVEGYARVQESDMMLRPDLSTFSIIPWASNSHKTARIICDVYNFDGKEPFEGDPRQVLKRAITNMQSELGSDVIFNAGPEVEFYLLRKTERGYVPHDDGSYFDYSPLDLAEDIRKDSALAMIDMGINFEVEHHEVGKGQHEIDFHFDDALTVADHVITCKFIVKIIARMYNTIATFMPKPFTKMSGNAMHVNQSLYDTEKGQNLFSKDDTLSELAHFYIGGLLEHAKALTAVTNPTINSYKRLVPGYEAPVYLTWGKRDRTSLVRIPAGNDVSRRTELRTPDSSCNPYLAMAVMLSAGMDGIKHRIDPGEPVEARSLYDNEQRRREEGVDMLPRTLGDALDELIKDDVIRDALGPIAYNEFMASAMLDWNDHCSQVMDWELERYINI